MDSTPDVASTVGTVTRGGRDMARETMERDRSAALAAVRDIVGGSRPSNSNAHVPSPPQHDAVTELGLSCDDAVTELGPSWDSFSSEKERAEFERKIISILKELRENKDFHEAVTCVRELNCSSSMNLLVSHSVNHVLEWSTDSRNLCGQFLHHLINNKLLTINQYTSGLKEVLAVVEDMEIDIPKVWQYLAEIISPMLQKDSSISILFLQILFEPIKQNCHVAEVIVYILTESAKRLGRSVVTTLWHDACLDWSMFLPTSNVDSFLIENDLKWVQTPDYPSVNGSGDADWVKTQLSYLIFNREASNEDIIKWVEDHEETVNTQTVLFIRTVVSVVSQNAITVDESKCDFHEERLKSRTLLLKRYINCNGKLELEALYALQHLVHQLRHPQNILLRLFEVFYNEEVISEDSFYQWQSSSDPTELDGKALASASVSRFFRWLRETPEDT